MSLIKNEKYQKKLYTKDVFENELLPQIRKSQFSLFIYQGGRLKCVSDSFFREFGYKAMNPEDVETALWHRPEERQRFMENIKKTIVSQRAENDDHLVLSGDGQEIRIRIQFACIIIQDQDPVCACLLVKNPPPSLTEQKLLNLDGNIFQIITEKALSGITLVNDRLDIIYANPAAVEIYGYDSLEEAKKASILNSIAPESLELVVERTKNRLLGHENSPRITYKIIRKDGQIRDVEVMSDTVYVNGMKCQLNSIIDITDRIQAEGEVQKACSEWRRTFDTISDIIMNIDSDYKITRVNKAATDILGLSFHEILSQKCFRLIHGTDAPPEYCPHSKTLVNGKENTAEIFEQNLERNFLITTTPMLDDAGNITGSVHVMHDITEKRKMEKDLLRAQKLESLGVLAGGIAHDFNNILTTVLGNISLAKMMLNPEDKIFNSLNDAEKASLRAKDLTQQLLTFSMGGEPIKETASIVNLIKDSARFALRGSNVRCEFSIPDDLWVVEIDEGQINQVISNLIINADQAMPEGGVINVNAENVTIASEKVLPLEHGKYVKISIRDHGIGIASEYLHKIFDPYFTTKHKGSGLGLATTYSIVNKHDGYIDVESELGVGTTFYIHLPASEKELLEKKDSEERSFIGKGKILFMDDEKDIRNFVGKLLKGIGYDVEFARDGAEAIELYKKAMKSGHPFDAVILDLTVPGGMGGKKAIEKLLKIDPDVKAIVSSGYSTDPVMAEYKKYGFCGVVAKPYKVNELSEILYKAITRES
jgi:PAS domain S-box-containing protein